MTKSQRIGSERAKLTSIIKERQNIYYRKARTHHKFMSPFLFDIMYLTEWVIKRKRVRSRGDRAEGSPNALFIAIQGVS